MSVDDPNGDTMDVSFFGRPAAGGPPAPDFTVVAIPDTQHYVDSSAREFQYRAQTQWIVNSRASLNTRFVTHLGDIVEHIDASEQEWNTRTPRWTPSTTTACPTTWRRATTTSVPQVWPISTTNTPAEPI